MTRRKKALLSIFLFVVSLCCFIFSPPSQTTTRTKTIAISSDEQLTETVEIQNLEIAKFLEWVGIGALVLAAWFWRKELGVTQLGPLSGPEPAVSQQPAGTPPKPPEESGPPPTLDLAAISKEMADATTQQQLQHIMQMFQKTHLVNVSYVSQELGVTSHTAKTLLYLLTKNGQLRADGFPRNTIYTPANSLENRILDAARQRLSDVHQVVSERRYVRVKRMYEIDSLVECEDRTFVVEAKILRDQDLLSRLDHWILQLAKVAKEFPPERTACVLAIGCISNAEAENVKKQLSSFTLDSSSVSVQIMVFSESELTG